MVKYRRKHSGCWLVLTCGCHWHCGKVMLSISLWILFTPNYPQFSCGWMVIITSINTLWAQFQWKLPVNVEVISVVILFINQNHLIFYYLSSFSGKYYRRRRRNFTIFLIQKYLSLQHQYTIMQQTEYKIHFHTGVFNNTLLSVDGQPHSTGLLFSHLLGDDFPLPVQSLNHHNCTIL